MTFTGISSSHTVNPFIFIHLPILTHDTCTGWTPGTMLSVEFVEELPNLKPEFGEMGSFIFFNFM